MFNSIRNKILSSQLSLALLAMLSLGIASYFLILNYLNSAQEEKLEYFADFEAEKIENYFIQSKVLLERMASSREFEDFHTTFKYMPLVKYFLKFSPAFSEISYVNIQGQEEVKVITGSPEEQNLDNYNKNLTFQRSLREPNEVIIGPVESSLQLGRPVVRFMLSRYAYFGDEFIGTLVGTVSLFQIGDMLQDKIGSSGFIALIDSSGNILSYPQEDKILTSIAGKSEATQKLLMDCKELKAGFTRAEILGVDSFISYAPLKETGWSLLAILPYQEFMAALNNFQKIAGVILIVLVILTLIISLRLTRGITGPVFKLVSAANFIARGNFSKRVDVLSKDEIGQLALAFNTMAEDLEKTMVSRDKLLEEIAEHKKTEEALKKAYTQLKETQNQLIQAEKLNAVGQLASGVAHEVRNPLGIILQGVNYLEKKVSVKENDTSEVLAMLKDSIHRANNIISALLDFSRAASSDLNAEDINSILKSSLNLVKARSEFQKIDVAIELEEGMPRVLADKNKLEQVFINILLNAVQAMPKSGGKIIIRSHAKELQGIMKGIGKREEDHFRTGEKAVIVEIEDSGSGISEESLKKIFDPFFTTKAPGSGVGLGLSVSRNIIHMHKGLIYAESQPGKGTKVVVILKITER